MYPIDTSSTPTQRSPAQAGGPALGSVRRSAVQDPVVLFGNVGKAGLGLLGTAGVSARARARVEELLEENHHHYHALDNKAIQHLLASYSLGAGPSLLSAIQHLYVSSLTSMPSTQSIPPLSDANWWHYVGEPRLYPNFLGFFARLVKTGVAEGRGRKVVGVVERYLLGGQGDMLVRAMGNKFHALTHLGYGLEFELDGVVAQALALCAISPVTLSPLFPAQFLPLSSAASKGLTSSITSAWSSFGRRMPSNPASAFLSATPPAPESFIAAVQRLERDSPRSPTEGLSAFTIIDRIGSDPKLDPMSWERSGQLPAGMSPREDSLGADEVRLGRVANLSAERVAMWCDEWRFSGEKSAEYEDDDKLKQQTQARPRKTPSWEEVADKAEELIWVAVALFASTSRPGYEQVKLDRELGKAALSCLFLPSLLEVVQPALRPYLLQAQWRTLVAVWLSRGRPRLYIAETLMGAPTSPSPPGTAPAPATGVTALLSSLSLSSAHATSPLHDSLASAQDDPDSPRTPTVDTNGRLKTAYPEDDRNAWPSILGAVAGHEDGDVVAIVRALAKADGTWGLGASEAGVYRCGMRGTERLDGSIFVRAAGLTLAALGWGRGSASTSALGGWTSTPLALDSTWSHVPLKENYVPPPRISSPVLHSPMGSPGSVSLVSLSQSQGSSAYSNKGKARATSPLASPYDSPRHSFSSNSPRVPSIQTRAFSPPGRNYRQDEDGEEVHVFNPNSSASSSSSLSGHLSPQVGSPGGRMVTSPDLGQTTIFFAPEGTQVQKQVAEAVAENGWGGEERRNEWDEDEYELMA